MNTLDSMLDSFARTEPDAEMVQDAQRKLEARLAARAATSPNRRRQLRGWFAAAASAAALAVAVLWLPLHATPAFAKVQKHFQEFRTLRFELEQRVNGEALPRTRVSVLANGSVRTEVGDQVVVIVNSETAQVLTLLPMAHMAVKTPLGATATKDDSLRWLEEVREFQGQARKLPETRLIRGQRAEGWELPAEPMNIVVWANEDGLPLEMQIGGDFQMDMNFHFEFDPVLPAELFSTEVPAGYSLQAAED